MALLARRGADLERTNYHAALICAVLANINRDPKRRPVPYQVADFMPQKAQPMASLMSEEDHLADLLALAGAMGAEVNVARDR